MIYWYLMLHTTTFKIFLFCRDVLLSFAENIPDRLWLRWSLLRLRCLVETAEIYSHDTVVFRCTPSAKSSATSPNADKIWCSHNVLQTSFLVLTNTNDYTSLTCIVWENPAQKTFFVLTTSHFTCAFEQWLKRTPLLQYGFEIVAQSTNISILVVDVQVCRML